MTTDTPEFIDALPYIDTAIDDYDEQRAIAMKEVDDEIDVFPPQKDYIEYLPSVEPRTFTTPLLEYEHFCIETNEPRPPSSELAKLQLDIPPSATTMMDDEELDAWNKCLNQVKIKFEYLQRHSANLERLKDEGEAILDQFIAHNQNIDSCLKKELNELNRRTHEVNWQRKSEQERIGKTLDILKNEWNTLASKNCLLATEIKRLSYQI